MNQRTFECPKCYVADSNFVVNINNEEKIEVEKNYNLKVEEFKKIIEEHNRNLKDEYYEEEVPTTNFLAIFPRTKKIKKLKPKYILRLNNYNIDHERGGINTFVSKFEFISYGIPIYTDYPINKNYQVKKYALYKHIECKICGYKQYF